VTLKSTILIKINKTGGMYCYECLDSLQYDLSCCEV